MENLFTNIASWIRNLVTGWGGSDLLAHWVVEIVAAVAILIFLLLNVIILVYLERKISGFIQERLGPNRAGPFGIFQLFLDIAKLIGKNSFLVQDIDRFVYRLVPVIVFVPSMLLFTVLPMGRGMVIMDSPAGLLFYFAASGLMVMILIMSGWSANNKYTLIGGMRAAVQMISYEIPLILSVVVLVMICESMSLVDIVEYQAAHGWFFWKQPLAFIIFLIAGTAEINRSPFDLPEGEQELVAGYQTEYSGMRFAMMYMAEYVNLFAMSALIATLFLGGWSGPFLPSWLWFFLKTYFMVLVNMWVRWTFPRIRIDHLMALNWKGLIPAALVNLVVTAAVIRILMVVS